MSHPSINRLAELQQFVADFAKVKRVVPLADTSNAENDVEHSYGLAITCWYLHDKIAPELNLSKILRYALSHDIPEIHAGDTYIFDTEAVSTKAAREAAAIVQLKKEWEDFKDLTHHTVGYANKIDEEAKFTYAVDKILPLIMVELGDAKSIWEQRKVTLEMQKKHKITIRTSDYVAPYYEMILHWLDSRQNIPKA
jgi:putative hydrolase of HD superfamily